MKWLIALLVIFTEQCRSDHQVANDIWKAFRAVSNDSALLSHIIPEMYGSSMSNANPTFVFKMPAGELLTMQRSDFAEPIFPNITTKPNMLVDVLQAPPLDTKTHVKSSLAEWQELGLEGWTGELKPPEPQLEQSHRDIIVKNEPDWRLPDYPHDQIILDLKSQRLDGRIKDIRVITSNSVEAQQEDLMNAENVYIARANDPFGYSMKWSLTNDTDPAKERGKRDVAKLYSMIKCSTNCDPLIYKGYGCYCGFGGHGVPNDGIDRCCRLHDKCYGQSNCISYLEYFVPYVWKCYRGKPLCAIDHGEWGGPDSCAARLCQCDLRLSRCLRNFYCPNRRAVCLSSRTRRLQNFIYY